METIRSDFLRLLRERNAPALDGFARWLWEPGMLFQAREQWWGDRKARAIPHEGIDLCGYGTVDGREGRLDDKTRIPAPWASRIVKIAKDFLGESIFLGHAWRRADGRRLYTFFGHMALAAGVGEGQEVAAGEVLGTLAGLGKKKTTILPHLHISVAWVPEPVARERLDWQTLGTDAGITFLDPVALLLTGAGGT